jgi:glyoxylase-like metal-dependent hydrolase (beta-lactamase superfamily II)
MKIDSLVLGDFQTNCYVVRADKASKDCLVIDAGFSGGQLIGLLKADGLNPVGLVLTHGHIDHIAGVAALRDQFPDIKVYLHELDSKMLTGEQDNLSAMTGIKFCTEPAEFLLGEGEVIEQAGITLKVLHTPGHTPGSISLYSKAEGIVFTGDSLFAGSVGRTDFPGGSMSQLIQSIRQKLLVLPDETVCYPGHGPATTIGREKATNPFL